MSYQIEIRLIGEDLIPKNLSSRDIGELISSIEQMIATLVARDNPALEIDESDVTIGLASIQQGSYIMQFETAYENATQKAYNTVANAINQNNYDALPYKSIEAIKSVRKITRKYKTDTQFWERNGTYKQIATVSPSMEIDYQTSYISGKTTIYGYVIGVVGDNPPRVRLRQLNGDIITCPVTKQKNLYVARQIGQHLYTDVGLRGIARWDVSSLSIEHFLVESLTEYRKPKIENALDSFYELVGESYDSVDINSIVADARGYEDFA